MTNKPKYEPDLYLGLPCKNSKCDAFVALAQVPVGADMSKIHIRTEGNGVNFANCPECGMKMPFRGEELVVHRGLRK